MCMLCTCVQQCVLVHACESVRMCEYFHKYVCVCLRACVHVSAGFSLWFWLIGEGGAPQKMAWQKTNVFVYVCGCRGGGGAQLAMGRHRQF